MYIFGGSYTLSVVVVVFDSCLCLCLSLTHTHTLYIHTHNCVRVYKWILCWKMRKNNQLCVESARFFFTIFLPNFDRSHEFPENLSAELDWLTVSQHFNAIISNLSPKISIDMAQNRHDHDVLCTKSISRLKRRIFTHDIWKSLFQWVCLYVFVYENGY